MTDTVTIRSLGQHGDGIAEIDGYPVYVPFALPGEKVEIALEGDRGTLLDVLEPSPERVEPISPNFGACGGCQLQHLALPSQQTFKRDLVETALRRAGIDTPVNPTLASPGGRQRTTLHARGGKVGYMRARSHDVLDIETCPILVPSLREASKLVRALHKAVGDCDVKLTQAIGLDVAIRTERKVKPQALADIAQRYRITRLALNGEVVFQQQAPLYDVAGAKVPLPVESFLQPTREGEEALAGLVLKAVEGKKRVADLFCGIGTFALRIARHARVFAVDGDKFAISALNAATRNTQGLKPITAVSRDLFREPLTEHEIKDLDAVVFDPPRAGAEAQVRKLAKVKIKTIVGVSCDPKTFARDASILIEGGYRLTEVTPVDQFAHSTHVELVGVFGR